MHRLGIVLAAVAMVMPSFAIAVEAQWVGGFAGRSFVFHDPNWVVPSSEDPLPPPGPGDTALFDTGGTSVIFNFNVTNALARVTSTKRFNLNGNTYDADLEVSGSGDLTINDGVMPGDVLVDADLMVNNSTMSGFEHTYFDDARAIFRSNSMLSGSMLTVTDHARVQTEASHVDVQDLTVGKDSPGSALFVVIGGSLDVGGTNGLVVGDNGNGIVGLIDVGTLSISKLTLGTTGGFCGMGFCSSGSLQLFGTTNFTHSTDLTVGQVGYAEILVDEGATLTAPSLTIGDGAHGIVEISDSDSLIDIGGGDVNLGVGAGGVGGLSVSFGGRLTTPGDLNVGVSGFGFLDTIAGQLTVNGDLVFGRLAGSSGSWNLYDEPGDPTVIDVAGDIVVGWDGSGEAEAEHSGETLTIDATNLIVGRHGDGSSIIEFEDFSAGTFNLSNSIIGDQANGTMILNGGGWNNTGDVVVGRGDPISGGAVDGTVAIAGTAVTSDSVVVGQYEDAHGQIDMFGGTWQINQGLVVGHFGTGIVRLFDGATMTTAMDVLIGNNALGGSGTLELSDPGTQLEVTTVGQGVKVGAVGDGTLTVSNGARLAAPFLRIGEGVGSDSSATITGADTVADIAGGIRIDETGNGRFTIADGAHVDSAIATIDNAGLGLGFSATVTGGDSLWTTIVLIVGKASRYGSLLIDNGGRVECLDCEIGQDTGSAGRLRLSDAGTHLHATDDLRIGGDDFGPGGDALVEVWSGARADVRDVTTVFAQGMLDVRNGGLFYGDSLDVRGYVGAINAGSFIGVTGESKINSRLDVFGGARVDAGSMTVANDSAAPSDIKVGGAGSILNVLGELRFSGNGDGTLAASNGAQVFSDTAVLDNGVGTFRVNTSVLDSGTWWQTDNLIIGTDSLHGGVAIESGGRMTCVFSCNVGAVAGARGLVTVTGANSIFDSTNGSITVAQFGTGALQASSGGEIYSVGGHVGKEPGSVGTVEIYGPASFWSSTADLHVGFERVAAEPGEAIVRLFNGARIAAPTVAVHDTGQLFGAGTIFGNLDNGGLVGAGFEGFPATLGVTEDYRQLADGVFTLEIGGTAQGTEFGFLNVGDEAALAGHLGVTLLGSYEPTLGDAFIILTASTVSGEFDTAFLPDLGPLEFFIVYGADFVSLAVVNPTAVPLPASYWLILSAMLMLSRWRRRDGVSVVR